MYCHILVFTELLGVEIVLRICKDRKQKHIAQFEYIFLSIYEAKWGRVVKLSYDTKMSEFIQYLDNIMRTKRNPDVCKNK